MLLFDVIFLLLQFVMAEDFSIFTFLIFPLFPTTHDNQVLDVGFENDYRTTPPFPQRRINKTRAREILNKDIQTYTDSQSPR